MAFYFGFVGAGGFNPTFSNSALKRVIKAPRMYFLDTGLCAHIMRWPSAEVLERSAMDGAFFETWVVSEIYKSYIRACSHNRQRASKVRSSAGLSSFIFARVACALMCF
jgi:predicted AAA+ superfamily ATPase